MTNKNLIAITVTLLFASSGVAHEGHSHAPPPETRKKIERLNTNPSVRLVATQLPATESDAKQPAIAKHFGPFGDKVNVRWDDRYLYVESDGMPAHPMMIGITAWQQQVPLPQSYTGRNAWRVPLHPVPAREPMSAKEHFFRGAIALAVNGIPIFNPIKNDGKNDTLLAGELDQWGGHCGRADDYHYHLAPVHLEKIVGKGNPVGIALDGYPIYGYEDADGSKPTLDWLNGHKDTAGNYHATKFYPYLNGGFYGEVVERDGQVDPQPRASGVRPALPPLRRAKITGFSNPEPGSYTVQYDEFGDKHSVHYTIADDGSVQFRFVSQDGTKTETYTPRQQAGGGGPRGAKERGAKEPGRQPQGNRPDDVNDRRGGGDPIARALDSNHDGEIDREELGNAVKALRTLDSNGDGTISAEELRGGGDGRGPRGPQEGDEPRQPWILVHAEEVDLNKDKIVSREEIVGQATKAFAGYDANQDDQLTQDEYGGRGGGSRSAMGGFIRGHAKELDRDSDGILSRTEVIGNAERMFDKMDSNGDGKITAAEMEASRRQ